MIEWFFKMAMIVAIGGLLVSTPFTHGFGSSEYTNSILLAIWVTMVLWISSTKN